ncbi:hypothetical protein K3Q66_001466 [Escherichia coli]|nr:hypothetical protein [Escherichia coli]EHX1372481.1 hypothetical protein [Escherichia coli]
MNEQRLFEMTSQTNLKGHVAKSIAPFQLRTTIIDVEMINSLIQEELLSPITIISCLRLFVNNF